jgi:hypothetical protein
VLTLIIQRIGIQVDQSIQPLPPAVDEATLEFYLEDAQEILSRMQRERGMTVRHIPAFVPVGFGWYILDFTSLLVG